MQPPKFLIFEKAPVPCADSLGIGPFSHFPELSSAVLSSAQRCTEAVLALSSWKLQSWRAATSYHYYHTNTDHNCCGFPPNTAHTSATPIWTGTFMSKIITKSKVIASRDHCADKWTHLHGLPESAGVGIYKLRTMRGDLLSQGGRKGWISLWKSPGCCGTVHTPTCLNIESWKHGMI